MSVAEAAHRPARTGRGVALWLGFLIVIAAGIGLAWLGAGSLRPVISASGLQFRTIKAGHGEVIGHDDAALLDYIATTDDGTILDSSQAHGGAQPFFIDMPGLYPGFAEAMTRMQEGGEYRFTMSQKLAFGNNPPPPEVPKGSNLTFEVRVQKIARGGAVVMMQQMQQMQAQQQQQQQAPSQ